MAAFVFILGLIFGSFANVIVSRLNTGESLIFGGSRCFFCGRNLRWFELIPVFSYLALGGKCRTCGSKISWQYPLVEIASGTLFLLTFNFKFSILNQFLTFNFKTTELVLAVLFFWLLLVISVYDLRHKIIPNQLVYVSIFVAILFAVLDIGILNLFRISDFGFRIFGQRLLSGLGLFSFFALLWAVSRGRWMGFGDAKLALALGLMLGWPESIAALFLSFWIGAVFGLGFVFIKKFQSLRVQIPFAPFLFTGGLIAFLWGDKIISWYITKGLSNGI